MVTIIHDSRIDLIPNSFSPRIVIFSSEEVDQACKRNQLSNFASLLQPFQSIPKVSVRHSNYASIIRPSFPLSFIPAEKLRDEVNEIGREDDTIWLDRSINRILTSKNLSKWLSESSHPIPIPPTPGPFKLKEQNEWINESIPQDFPEPINDSAPWYNAFLKSVLDRRLPTVFDTSSHPIAALIVVSTNDPEPLNEFAKLYEESNTSGLGWPNVPWLDTEPILRYYVLLHETTEEFDGGRQEANQLLQSVSRAYGLHCGIVCMNSEKTEYIKRQRALNTDPHFKYDHSQDDPEGRTEDLWAQYQSEIDGEGNAVDSNQKFGECMAQEDILGLKVFLREFTIQSLIPHMERCVQHWNELLSASRKGITGRLFSVGRKYFSKPDSSGSSSSYNPTMRWYPYQSTEFQTRRLADYAFMLGDYRLASQMYEYVRKDALSDKAWSYYLSSTHMVGLCSLLLVVTINQTYQNFDPYSYLFDPAALSQMSVFDSLRIALIYHEACKSIGESRCMASSLLRMASLLDDITAAILYEQTAKSLPPRQSILYFVLSSRCYEVSGQRSLSTHLLRYCIEGGGWNGIADYVDDVLGRQASNETRWDLAVNHCWKLIKRRLVDSRMGDGDKDRVDDQGYLDNLQNAFENLNQEERKIFENSDRFIKGMVDIQLTRIRIPEQEEQDNDGYEEDWGSLRDRLPVDWKLKKEDKKQVAIVGVPFYLDLTVKNPLNTMVKMTDIKIRVNGLLDEDLTTTEANDETPEGVVIEEIPDLELLANDNRIVPIKIACTKSSIGIKIESIEYKFHDIMNLTQPLAKKGKRLNDTLFHRMNETYEPDESMKLEIKEDLGRIKVLIDDLIPTELLAGETIVSEFEVKNVGLGNVLQLACVISHNTFFRIGDPTIEQGNSVYSTSPKDDSNLHDSIQLPNSISDDPPMSICDELKPSESIKVPLICRGEMVGHHKTFWYFVFKIFGSEEFIGFRYVHRLNVLPSLNLKPIIRPSMIKEGFYVLTLEIENEGIPEEVEIYNITTIGTHWNSQMIQANQFPIKILNGNRNMIVFEFKPWSPSSLADDLTLPFILNGLKKLLGKENLRLSERAPEDVDACVSSSGLEMIKIDHPILQKTILNSHKCLRKQSIVSHFKMIPLQSIPKIFPLSLPNTLNLILFWKHKDGKEGHHFLSDLRIGSLRMRDEIEEVLDGFENFAGGIYAEAQALQRNLIDEWRRSEFCGAGAGVGVGGKGRIGNASSKDEECFSIICRVDEGDYFDWDFKALGPKRLKVTFELKNLGISKEEIEFRLKLNRNNEEGVGIKTLWIGSLIYNGKIKSLDCKLIETEVWMICEGILDLGQWDCEVIVSGIGQRKWKVYGERKLVSIRDFNERFKI